MLTPYKIIDVITCPFNNAPHLFHRDNMDGISALVSGAISELITLDVYNDTGTLVDTVTISWNDNYSNKEALAAVHAHFTRCKINDFCLANLVICRKDEPVLWMFLLPL